MATVVNPFGLVNFKNSRSVLARPPKLPARPPVPVKPAPDAPPPAVACEPALPSPAPQYVYARALKDMPGYCSAALSEDAPTIVKKGAMCQLFYPMKIQEVDEGRCYFMRCRTVDEVRGNVKMHWVHILTQTTAYKTKKATTRRFIGPFSVAP